MKHDASLLDLHVLDGAPFLWGPSLFSCAHCGGATTAFHGPFYSCRFHACCAECRREAPHPRQTAKRLVTRYPELRR